MPVREATNAPLFIIDSELRPRLESETIAIRFTVCSRAAFGDGRLSPREQELFAEFLGA